MSLFCAAAILYELLYEGVFKVDHSVLAQCQRGGKSDVLSDDNLPLCGSSDESDTDAGEALWCDSSLTSQDKTSLVMLTMRTLVWKLSFYHFNLIELMSKWALSADFTLDTIKYCSF